MTRDDDAGLGVTFSPVYPRDHYLIWSLEHAAWWGPNENGYTRVLAAAGRYSHADALRIVERANFALVHECAIPVECVEPHEPRRFDRSVVYLHDGREIDLTGLSVDEAIAKMRALGITTADVRETIHHTSGKPTRHE